MSYSIYIQDNECQLKSNPAGSEDKWFNLLFNRLPALCVSFLLGNTLCIVIDVQASISYCNILPQSFRDRKRRLTGCKLASEEVLDSLGGRDHILNCANALRQSLNIDASVLPKLTMDLTSINLYFVFPQVQLIINPLLIF